MLHDQTVVQFAKMLQNLSAFFEKATANATTRKFDPNLLATMRLAPDQFPLARQVQIACDTARLGVCRLTGREATPAPDTETTLAELRERVESTVAFLRTVRPDEFAGAEERQISQPRWAGKWLTGAEFAHRHVIPNFYFHVTTAYAILRHNGVDLGKKDYLGTMPLRDPAA